jgi:hypothetical protein
VNAFCIFPSVTRAFYVGIPQGESFFFSFLGFLLFDYLKIKRRRRNEKGKGGKHKNN